MLNQGRDYRSKMNDVVARLQSHVEGARKQKDLIRLNCLMDKLVQVKANLNIADQALQAVQEAIARRDEGASMHEYTRLTIVHQKVQMLGSEAEACIGEDLSFVGATRVDVDIDPSVPNDPYGAPAPARPEVVRPPYASPMR